MTELDLAAIRARAEAPQCRDSSGSRPLRCGDLDLHGSFHCPECRTAKDVLALVDAVERLTEGVRNLQAAYGASVDELETLRAKIAAVEALCAEWERDERDADPWYWSDAGEELRALLAP